MDRNKLVFLAGLLALDEWLLVVLSLSGRSGFMPEQVQDVLLVVASMAGDVLHILLRLLSLHLCNGYPSLPGKKKLPDWNCVAEDLDLVGGQPGTRQHGFQSGLLPFQQVLSLQDAFRCLHPQAREFTHTATNNVTSARIDRWLISDSLLPDVSSASVTDIILSDHYGVAVSLSPANAPPRGPGLWSMPPAIISHLSPHDSSEPDLPSS